MEYKCPYSDTLVNARFACTLATSVVRRGGPEVACASATAHAHCDTLFQHMKQAALPAFGVEDNLLRPPSEPMDGRGRAPSGTGAGESMDGRGRAPSGTGAGESMDGRGRAPSGTGAGMAEVREMQEQFPVNMPHSVLIKIQHGGLLGLQRIMDGAPTVDQTIANINDLVERAHHHYGDYATIPYSEFVQDMTAYKLRRRGAG